LTRERGNGRVEHNRIDCNCLDPARLITAKVRAPDIRIEGLGAGSDNRNY